MKSYHLQNYLIPQSRDFVRSRDILNTPYMYLHQTMVFKNDKMVTHFLLALLEALIKIFQIDGCFVPKIWKKQKRDCVTN